MADVTPLRRRPTTVEFGEGDIAVDAAGSWLCYQEDGWWTGFGAPDPIDDPAEPLTLIARAGETADLVRARQAYMAIEEQNAGLIQIARSQQRYLDRITERVDVLADHLRDARGDLKHDLARLDPTGGDQ